MYDIIFHADWSINPNKRWVAMAERCQSGWEISSLAIAPCNLTAKLMAAARDKRVLAGFDFPIGVPARWADKMKLESFLDFLKQLRNDAYPAFFEVAGSQSEISLERPFYPAVAKAGVRREHLYSGLGLQEFDELRRKCEGRTDHRQPACPLFWTLGANQVGKGALSGWREVIMPCVKAGARLWPFDGELGLESSKGLTIAETYPAEIYGWLEIDSIRKAGKRNQDARRPLADKILKWASGRGISIASHLQDIIRDGFGDKPDGEDQFDAFCGACGMIQVASGQRESGAPTDANTRNFEGWILGLRQDDLIL